uniref:gluconeogenesis factor YvcK family protein n=1 Tax=Clostridium polynesiense TaxID=1325933 RepID=UPI00058D908E
MRMWEWLRPGIKIKRWILFALLGILLIGFGINEFVIHKWYTLNYKLFWLFLNASGFFILYISVTEGMKSIVALINKGYLKVSFDNKKIENLIYEKRLLVKGPRIVVIGGGTGLSTMLRGLKYYTSNVTAIVTVADDGGGSGDLREDLGMLAPGDIRNCILALADTEPLMEELLQYRFKDGRLKNQSFGNLFLAAMDGISDNFEDAVQKMSSVLAVTGKVLPVTLDDMKLKAELSNGSIVEGESVIPEEALEQKSSIKRLMIEPENAQALPDALEAIYDADAIIMGPGSLYTSVLPNLLVKDIANAVKRTKAIRIYVSNIMTQPGETDNFTVADHVKTIYSHIGSGVIDYVVANVEPIEDDLKEKYLKKI